MKHRWIIAMLLAMTFMQAAAQVKRVGSVGVKPQLTLGDTLTVVASPSIVTFQLVSAGVAFGSAPVVITTSMTGLSLLSSVTLYGYFMNPAAALSGGAPSVSIPSSCIFAKDPTGTPTAFTAFTQNSTLGSTGGSLQLFSVGAVLSLGGSRVDTVSLEIDLTSVPTLPAAPYSGTLLLVAQAF